MPTSDRTHFWSGKRVLVTGHTGFKGGWLTIWLHGLGAQVIGLSDGIPTTPSLVSQAGVEARVLGLRGDVGDLAVVQDVVTEHHPDVVFHLAAQSIVRTSYADPVTTFRTNVLGTANVLEALRGSSVRAAVIVTTDKCYENNETDTPYREDDRLGGRDPYSASKAAAELVTRAYRESFSHGGGLMAGVATARSGNVIGGGDWSADRLLPDAARAVSSGETLVVRNPGAVRPWQHVLDCLDGYLLLAERLWDDPGVARAWNFGPAEEARSVEWVINRAVDRWEGALRWRHEADEAAPKESHLLRLDARRAGDELGWHPRLDTARAIDLAVDWYLEVAGGADAWSITTAQVEAYSAQRSHAA